MTARKIALSWTQPTLSGTRVSAEFTSSLAGRGGKPGQTLHEDRIQPHLASNRQKFISATLAKAAALNGQATWPSAAELDTRLIDAAREVRAEAEKAQAAPSPNSTPYFVDVTTGHTLWRQAGGDTPMRLARFNATITREIALDDGVEVTAEYEIVAHAGIRARTLLVPARQFSGLSWVGALGHDYILEPGQGAADRFRHAVQMLSQQAGVREQVVYSHTGWRQLAGGDWIFLHSAGAIGAAGALDDMEVRLPTDLEPYRLPAPPDGEARTRAIRASLGLLEVARDQATAMLGGVYRVVLPTPPPDFTVTFFGHTGSGKTTFATLGQQHFGSGWRFDRLPGSWSSTGNSLEALAFVAKNVLLVVDDWAPEGTVTDIQQMRKAYARVIRAQGNTSGRGRLRSDGTRQPTRYPRGLVLSTGEDVPGQQSSRARQLIVDFPQDALDWSKVSDAQAAGAQGLYAQAMSAFLVHLATHHAELAASLPGKIAELRDRAYSSALHRRTPSIVAQLQVAVEVFVDFALGCGAIAKAEHQQIRDTVWETLGQLAQAQAQHFASSEPTARFFALLRAAIDRGAAHVAYTGGETPATPQLWGWQRRTVGTGDFERTEWHPLGERIGWIDKEDVYLQPDVAYAAAQRMARASDELFAISAQTLRKRLYERGLLASVKRHKTRVWLTVERQIQGDQRSVLHIRREELSSTKWNLWNDSAAAGAGQVPNGASGAPETGKNGALFGQNGPVLDPEMARFQPEIPKQGFQNAVDVLDLGPQTPGNAPEQQPPPISPEGISEPPGSKSSKSSIFSGRGTSGEKAPGATPEEPGVPRPWAPTSSATTTDSVVFDEDEP